MAIYPSSLTDTEWEILQPLLPQKADTMRGRPVENPRREIIDGILYILRTGGAWRMMPNDLPHWKTCCHYFRLWSKLVHWERIHNAIRDLARMSFGKKSPDRCDPRQPERSDNIGHKSMIYFSMTKRMLNKIAC